MQLDLVLVRHGESAGNRDRLFTGHGPSPLTERGRLQAEAAARALVVRPVHGIYTSDLARARETAAPLAALLGRDPVATAQLRERDVGEWTNLTFEQVQERSPDGWQALLARDPDHRPPGGESHRDCGARVGAFLDELFLHPPHADLDPARPVLRLVLVSHGVAINHMLRHLLGLGPGHGRFFFTVDNCSFSRVGRAEDGTVRVHTVNDTAHLSALPRDAPAP